MAKVIFEKNRKFRLEEKVLNLEGRNYMRAEKYLNKTPRKLKYIGNKYFNEKKYKLGLKCIRIVIGMENGRNMQNLYWMGFLLTMVKPAKIDLAVKYFQKAANGGYKDAYYPLGAFYTELGEYKLAEFYLKRAEENKDNSSLKGLGDLYTILGNYELASYYYDKGIEIFKDTNIGDTIMCNLGNMYQEQKKYKEAEYYYRNILDRRKHRWASYKLGTMYEEMGDCELAEKYYKEANHKKY